ncbi:hypothetical protein ACLKA6_005337 [Drosophila palustris]
MALGMLDGSEGVRRLAGAAQDNTDCVVALLLLPSSVHGQQQKFRTVPHDLQVLEGSEAMMRCEVANVAGAVQWTKDGFALGFSAVIPGYPRYSVLGDRKQGVYNLRISNASTHDDAEYQCQVGPARLNSAIRANAKLTVISPPASIEIKGYSHNSKVEVRENQDLTLKCIVANAKPEAQIVWYRGNVEYKPDKRDDKVEETMPKRFTTTSSLKLKPGPDDDYTEYTCQAKHKALSPDMPMRATVQLSVLYPPGPPYIEGYSSGDTLRRGQLVELMCRSRGGNPPAQLIWYKNGSQIRMAYRTSGRLSENIYSFTAEAGDNKARFRCEASNVMSQTPLKAEVDLSVLFAPAQVTVTGPTEARVGDVVPLTCSTAPSNPPAEIKWMVAGRQVRNATSKTTVSSEGGWTTSSNITTTVEPNKRSLVVICHGLNMQLTENVVATHTINVLYGLAVLQQKNATNGLAMAKQKNASDSFAVVTEMVDDIPGIGAPSSKTAKRTSPKKGKKALPTDLMRYRMWQEHRQRLLEVVSDLDNRPPGILAVRKTGVNSLSDNAVSFMARTRENIQMLVAISQTQRTHGAIDPFRYEQPYVMSAVPGIISNLERLDVENKEFGKRIAEITGEVDSGLNADTRTGKKDNKLSASPVSFFLPEEALAKYKPFNIKIPSTDKERRQVFRPRIYFDICLKDVRPLGQIVVQLYTEAAPVVVLQLVKSCMCNMNNKFHIKRLFPNLWLEVEMPVENNTQLQRPLEYDGKVIDHGASSYVLSFSKDYLQGFNDHLSFSLSFKPLSVANGSRIGFGRVVKNSKIFDCLQSYGTKNGTLSRGIVFTGCGVL